VDRGLIEWLGQASTLVIRVTLRSAHLLDVDRISEGVDLIQLPLVDHFMTLH
jgi:hypothetical protein